MLKRTVVVLLALAVPGMLLLSGCDSDGTEDRSVSEEALTSFNDMMSDVFEVMNLVFTQVQPVERKVEGSSSPADLIPCPEGGQIDFEGSVDADPSGSSVDFALSMSFQNCNGINGNLSTTGEGSFSNGTLQYETVLDGTLEETCVVSYDSFRQQLTANTASQEFTFTLDGSIEAACNDEHFTCEMDGLVVSQDAGPADFEGVCRRD